MRCDIAVVGLGLIGSAAVRYLAQQGVDVVGIGVSEPADSRTHHGPFASHYDSGRITRRLDARYEWAVLASRSIARYAQLEAESGLRFHHPCGLLFVRNDPEGIAHQQEVIHRLSLPVTVTATEEYASAHYALPSGWTVLSEPGPAGFIDPRAMLAAQLTLAARSGATLHRSHVTSLEVTSSDCRQVGIRLSCADGTTTDAERVLLATGPYANDLVPDRLAARVVPEAVVLARVSETVAEELGELPSLICLLEHSVLDDVYVVPPTRYPDGNWYVKMGGSHSHAVPLETFEAKREWMAGDQVDAHRDVMQSVLTGLLPDVPFESFTMKPCLITDTAHGLPYLDEVERGLFVAVGGNGHAAKSADAIGVLAARMISGAAWPDDELEASAFAAVHGALPKSEGSRHGH